MHTAMATSPSCPPWCGWRFLNTGKPPRISVVTFAGQPLLEDIGLQESAQNTGRCLCGAVTWAHTGETTRNLNCHCDECRRGVSAAFTSVKGFRAAGLKIIGPWQDYRYTAKSSRAFCARCGTRIWFRSELWADEVFMNVGALARPEAHQPDRHVLFAEAVGWAAVGDRLPRSERYHVPFPGASGSSSSTKDASAPLSGRCLCGAVRWETEAEPLWGGHCHCDSCRRATGAPFVSFFGMPRAALLWSGTTTNYCSSNGQVSRRFCSACGTHMAYHWAGWPDETHLYAATLHDSSRFVPQAHFHYAERLPWLVLDDSLPRHPQSANAP